MFFFLGGGGGGGGLSVCLLFISLTTGKKTVTKNEYVNKTSSLVGGCMQLSGQGCKC